MAGFDTPEELQACRVMTSTEQTWTKLFAADGERYPAPVLNFYEGGVQSGCGQATSAAGPFYCPADRGIYLDTAFFRELATIFKLAQEESIDLNTAKGSYNYFLPSANIAFDLSQEVKLRLAAYRAIARSGIESFGAGGRLIGSRFRCWARRSQT